MKLLLPNRRNNVTAGGKKKTRATDQCSNRAGRREQRRQRRASRPLRRRQKTDVLRDRRRCSIAAVFWTTGSEPCWNPKFTGWEYTSMGRERMVLIFFLKKRSKNGVGEIVMALGLFLGVLFANNSSGHFPLRDLPKALRKNCIRNEHNQNSSSSRKAEGDGKLSEDDCIAYI